MTGESLDCPASPSHLDTRYETMEKAACSKFQFVKELSMTPVRQRMTEDMQVRNLSPHTQTSYVQQVSLFARYFGKSPELLGPRRDSCLPGLPDQRKEAGYEFDSHRRVRSPLSL